MASINHEELNCNSDSKFQLKGVYDLLDKLNIPENPSWKIDANVPSTSEMLNEIVDNLNDNIYNTKMLDELKVKYVLNTNQGENEGTQTIEDTENALNNKDEKNINYDYQVSRNLLAAINHLEELNSGDDKELLDVKGLLDVQEFIQKTHKILMKNLLESNKCGKFSTNIRKTTDGHVFPKFDKKEHAYDAVLRVVDRYNDTIQYIKKNCLNPNKKVSMHIRCAAWILYNFVTLHPFADGNGRMCRLLASHCLHLVFPFPCPIYNIYAPTTRDDYLEAIKKARCDNGEDLGDLVALLIESGWYSVNHFSQCDKN